ncbi:hypothetical protein D187_001150 [Cystobacter fuscus DSM 2262]|uniref:Uncharacterized protein n=1 Tax=Cystobacter fuscus (strain ATCC 25194 / DSM 2262 / NBRC 100088 / M29) TaxID=1242864 RepID=S9PG34_CYSF2|nr:hypothetical protein D187_001150 [Cystobacter fuscus DSM 2262]
MLEYSEAPQSEDDTWNDRGPDRNESGAAASGAGGAATAAEQ